MYWGAIYNKKNRLRGGQTAEHILRCEDTVEIRRSQVTQEKMYQEIADEREAWQTSYDDYSQGWVEALTWVLVLMEDYLDEFDL